MKCTELQSSMEYDILFKIWKGAEEFTIIRVLTVT